MSTSPRYESEADTGELHEDLADFLRDTFDETRATCRAHLARWAQVHFLSHYTDHVFDFSLDRLSVPGAHRAALQRLGRQLGFEFVALDRMLREPGTGALIRMVLHTEEGVALCVPVVPMQNVVGICFSAITNRTRGATLVHMDDVRATDRAVSELATRLRGRISLGSLNPGGWESAEDVQARPITHPVGKAESYQADIDVPERIADACDRAARPDDLQFVAYCAESTLLYSVDHLGDRSLDPFFQQITVDRRRVFYRGFSERFMDLATRLNRLLTGARLPGLIVRAALDVEQGALYFYRLDGDKYLVGVTIDQARVSGADERMAQLAASCVAN